MNYVFKFYIIFLFQNHLKNNRINSFFRSPEQNELIFLSKKLFRLKFYIKVRQRLQLINLQFHSLIYFTVFFKIIR